ncbi:MAG TPA: glycosyl hydrolase family 18 protein, partial [Kiritimatiellia bacterium]|nr:glycosyl hydrolase family 18 protein [Kiritimatiellia bacterium]
MTRTTCLFTLAVCAALGLSLPGRAVAGDPNPATPEDESANWTVTDPVDQDFSEGTPAPASREAAPAVLPVSIHQAEAEYYKQFRAVTESDWDAVRRDLREKELGAAPRALTGASTPGPFTLQKEVFGWYPSWEGSSYTNFEFTLLSTVAYFNYEVNAGTGYAVTMNSWSNTPLVYWAHSNNVDVVLCATLMSNHAAFFGSAAAQSNLINELVRVVQLRGAEGVNIDFEAIASGYAEELTLFMSNLTVRMHAQVPGSQVSICLPSVDWSSNFDVAEYEGFLDKCIIMGYDYSWSTDDQAGPVAPLKGSAIFSSWCVQKSVTNYLDLGLSPGKLLLGCPYYGYDWPTVSHAMHADTTGDGTARQYPSAESYAGTYGYNWDTNSLTPYVLYGSYRQLWYDDTNSLGLKYDFVNMKELAGIGIWALNYDEGTSDLWDLLASKFAGEADWQSQDPGTTASFYGVDALNGQWAAVGAGGVISTSGDDGLNWTSRVSGTGSLLLNVVGGGGLWVAVGDTGTVVTSSGGATWTTRSTPTNAMLRGAAYGNGAYVTAGAGGVILRSTDGSTWAQQVSGTTNTIQGVNYVGSLFIATGENSVLLTSSDGISWTSRTSNAGGWLLDAAYGNGAYVAVGIGSRVVTSPDGTTWTRQTNDLPSASANLYRVAFGSGQFVAVGQGGVIWGSTDGSNWTAEVSGTTNFLRGVAFSNDLFMAAGYNGTILTKGAGAPSVEIATAGATVPNATSSQTVTGAANAYVVGTMRWTNSLGGSGTFAAATPWSFSASLSVGTNVLTVTGTNTAGSAASDSVSFIRQAAEGGGGSGSETTAAAQPGGALSDVVVFTSAGHGFTYNSTYGWITGRGLDNQVVEDIGNIDQLNYFAEYCFKAGATVVPFRPLGQQTNEVVLDNTNSARVTFGGTWSNSTSSTYYGEAGATPYRYAYINSTATTAWAIYRPNLPAAGFYPVYAWARSGSDRVKQLYRVYHSGGVTDVRVNHRRVGLGWVWLGTYYFDAGTNHSVNISNYAPDGYLATDVVIADAIRFGNGMGNIDRGAGVSGLERELEASRYWVQSMVGQGMSSTLYDSAGLDDTDDNVGAPNRMAYEMNRESDGGYFDRIYLGFHSNAGSGAGRGPMGLYDTRFSAPYSGMQQVYATKVAAELTNDLGYGDLGVWFPDSFTNNTANLYGSMYGEIFGAIVSNEMNSTIIEVGYHDNLHDTYLLRCPSARRVMAMASYQAIVKYLSASNAAVSSVLLPDPPTDVSAVNDGAGAVTVAWQAPVTNKAGGSAATGYIVYRSTNGFGFGNPVTVPGAATLSATLTNMTAGQIYYFQVCATNAGGESLASKTVGVRVSPAGYATHLVVNGFERNERRLTPTRYYAYNIDGDVARVIQRTINSQDYVIQYGTALAAAGRYFDSCDNDAVADGDIDLTDYFAAYWILGRESTADETISDAEQALVTAFLNQSNRLFVSGTELGWDLQQYGAASDKSFCSNYLKTAYVADDAGTNVAAARASGVFGGLANLVFDYTGTGPVYRAAYPDTLATAGSPASTAALVYGTSAGGASVAAISYSNQYRLVVMGFPFETILDASARTNLMRRTLDFFGSAPADSPVTDITNGNASVANAVGSIVIGGTNNPAVIGQMTW